MERRDFLRLMGYGAALGMLPTLVSAQEKIAKRPNILFVFSDMQRAYSMGCYGDKNARTPNLDKFAKEGIRMDSAISNTPVCCPFRACLMSGQYAHNHGMISNGTDFYPKVKCIAETFRDAGYETGYAGKWHLEFPKKAADRRVYFPAEGTEYGKYTHEREPVPDTELAMKFIREKSKAEKPWMFFVSWIMPHTPYKASAGFAEHFSKIEIPPNVPEGAAREHAEKALPEYYGMIEGIDVQFGRLMQELEKAGAAEDTIVVFTSDHGDMIGSHGYKVKRWPHEESARIPFLIRYPRSLPAGRTIEDPFGAFSIYPTLAGLAGVEVPKGLDGMDYSQLLIGKSDKPPRDYVYMEMHYAYVPWPGWRAIRTRDMMYARTVDKPWLLFDLKKDPWEMKNLVDDPAQQELVRKMDDRLQSIMKETGDSWELKATSGDLENWVPGGSKQDSQNLGHSYPGEIKSKEPAGKKKKKGDNGE